MFGDEYGRTISLPVIICLFVCLLLCIVDGYTTHTAQIMFAQLHIHTVDISLRSCTQLVVFHKRVYRAGLIVLCDISCRPKGGSNKTKRRDSIALYLLYKKGGRGEVWSLVDKKDHPIKNRQRKKREERLKQGV